MSVHQTLAGTGNTSGRSSCSGMPVSWETRAALREGTTSQ